MSNHLSSTGAVLAVEAEPTDSPAPDFRPPSGGSLVFIAGRQLMVALRLLIAMSVILGIAYPLLVLGLGRLIAPSAAQGSLIVSGGTPIGSSNIGQSFTDAEWFQGRPSAAGADGYDATSSGGSNLAADSDALRGSVNERRAAIARADGVPESAVPADAVTASASGLDPDISVAYALIQVDRVAAARNLSAGAVRDLVTAHISEPVLGFIGQERVNVLGLNLALQKVAPGS